MTCFKALLIICLSTFKKSFVTNYISINYKEDKNSKNDFLNVINDFLNVILLSKNDFLNVFDDIYFYMSFLILIFAEHS
jgi:hypothetical protein